MQTSSGALYAAAYHGRAADVEALLADGAELDWRHPDGGATALYLACELGHGEVARLLVEAGASVNAARDDGALPLCTATNRDNTELVALLLREGAAVDAADASGLTPLYAACHSKRVEVAKLLLEGRADPMLRCHGWSCLDLARREDAPEALRDLVLQHVAAADARRGGATALERLRAVTLQAKAAYGAILKARPAAELDTELGQMTTGELLTQAMSRCDWVLAASHGDTSASTQRHVASTTAAAAASPAAAPGEDDDVPNWLFFAAMHLGSTEGAAPTPPDVSEAPAVHEIAHEPQDAPPVAQQQGAQQQRARRTRKTGD